MTTPIVIPLTAAQFAAAKRSTPITSAELLRSSLSAGARVSQGSAVLSGTVRAMSTYENPYGIGVMPPMRYNETFGDTRRWAWFNIGAFMMGRDTGYVHGPALPDLDGPNAAPMNSGPINYGDDGESRCYWDLPS